MLKIEPGSVCAANVRAFTKYAMADTAKRSGEADNARKHAREGLADAQTLEKSSDIRMRALAARSHAFAADIFARVNDSAAAETESEKADMLAKRIATQVKPDDDFTLRTLALVHRALGGVEDTLEHREHALDEYSTALSFEAKTFEIDRKKDRQAGFNTVRSSITTWSAMGEIEMKLKHYDEAQRAYEKNALRIARKVLEWDENPKFERNESQRNEARRDVWDMLCKSGDVLAARKKTRAEAVKFYREAVTLGETLLKADPSSTNRLKMEDTLLSLANTEKMVRHVAEARTAYERRIASIQER